ncbi:MAG: phospholipase D-like domain-containing protein, partial [Cetobacterium sp.]
GIGLPEGMSRKQFVGKNLKDFNNTKELKGIIERVVDNREYIAGELNLENVVNEINLILVHDGYRLKNEKGVYKLIVNK